MVSSGIWALYHPSFLGCTRKNFRAKKFQKNNDVLLLVRSSPGVSFSLTYAESRPLWVWFKLIFGSIWDP